MFDELTASGSGRRLPRYAAASVGAHAGVIALFVIVAAVKAREPAEKRVEVTFVGPGKTAGAPPPPPPPAGKKHVTPKRKPTLQIARAEIPRLIPREVEPPKEEPADEPEGEEGGVEGGVKGGVQGGVVGGVVGSTGGGGSAPPPEPPKAKNVPPFVIAKDVINSPLPRMSEMYKATHRGQPPVDGMYKVCVGTDGRVYEVTPIKPVAGADEQIVETIRGEWEYKPQNVPVCFLYNMHIVITQ